jgi:hypothetical protein
VASASLAHADREVAVRSVDRLAMLDLDSAAPVILTQEGRRLLTQRAHALRVEVLPRLRAALEDLSAMAASTPSTSGRSTSCAV